MNLAFRCDTKPMTAAMEEIKPFLSRLDVLEAVQLLLSRDELVAFDTDLDSTRAGECVVTCKPTQLFEGLLTTLRAGERNIRVGHVDIHREHAERS